MKKKPTTAGPFLKWAGGKRKQVSYLSRKLPAGQRLVEPFVGAGAVFMGTDYDAYLLADTNQDLIDLYHILISDGQNFVRYARHFFNAHNSTEARYYQLREQFNEMTQGTPYRAALFLYLNRHGYNGLCRYNSAGGFNVPFGAYRKPYFPDAELIAFRVKVLQRDVRIVCQDFRTTFAQLQGGDVVYCDPPYIPISQTAHFTGYTGKGFGETDQRELAQLAREAAAADIPIVINNHSHPVMNRLYRQAGAAMSYKRQGRSINSDSARRGGVVESTASWNIGPITNRKAA